MKIELPEILENELVRITPLKSTDFDLLFDAACDPKIWEYHPAFDRYKKEVFRDFFDGAIQSIGPVMIWDKAKDIVIGGSRFNQVPNREDIVEIGWTFLRREYWGKNYNRSFKSLMINFGLERYTDLLFYVDKENIISQKAMTKLGALKYNHEGTDHIPMKKESHFIYVINKDNWRG